LWLIGVLRLRPARYRQQEKCQDAKDSGVKSHLLYSSFSAFFCGHGLFGEAKHVISG
jgi:hypothetical protein